MGEYMGTSEAARRWGTERDMVSIWCRKGLIEGAEQDAPRKPWRIPDDAEKPKV